MNIGIQLFELQCSLPTIDQQRVFVDIVRALGTQKGRGRVYLYYPSVISELAVHGDEVARGQYSAYNKGIPYEDAFIATITGITEALKDCKHKPVHLMHSLLPKSIMHVTLSLEEASLCNYDFRTVTDFRKSAAYTRVVKYLILVGELHK